MKYLLPLVFAIALISSCKTATKNYLAKLDDDKTLYDAVKALAKNSGDTLAAQALPLLYQSAEQRHLRKISDYSSKHDLLRWDMIISEYTILENMYIAISNNNTAYNLVQPKSYQQYIYDSRQNAAQEYYSEADRLLDIGGRENSKQAYNLFKKSDKFVPGFKDVGAAMKEAYESAIINVVINPIADNSFFFNTGNWGNYGYNYSNEYFQQTLVRELGGSNGTRFPARFYTDWEARRDNVQPDWVVDLTLRNMNIPYPTNSTYRRNVSKQIEVGRDTANKPQYQNVHATINITRYSFDARADMQVRITDINSRREVNNNSYSEYYNWQEETATYSGDRRALSNSDWDLINNGGRFTEPRREDVLNELYRKLYSQVRNRIIYAVDW